MNPEIQAVQTLQDAGLKIGRTSPKFVKLIESIEALFDERARLTQELRRRFPIWKMMARLGLDINDSKGVMFERTHQVRPELVTKLTFKDRVFHREWQASNYGETDYGLVGRNRTYRAGILEEDLNGWLEHRKIDPDDLFCPLFNKERRITHIIFNKNIDLPKREVILPVPVYFPRA